MAEPRIHFMPLNVYDIESDRDCRLMKDAQFGRYIRLLIRQWIEGNIPAAAAEALTDAKLDLGSETDVTRLLETKFTLVNGNLRSNPKCAEIRASTLAKIRKRKKSGHLGGVANATANAPPKEPPFCIWVLSYLGSGFDTPEFRAAWELWEDYRVRARDGLSPQAVRQQAKFLKSLGVERAILAIEQSVRNDWTGIFPPKQNGQSGHATPEDRKAMFAKAIAESSKP